jgi:hypothetical protein
VSATAAQLRTINERSWRSGCELVGSLTIVEAALYGRLQGRCREFGML